jgi:hypothetical protein
MDTRRKDWHELVSQPVYEKMKVLKDLSIMTQDGVRLAGEAYLPDAEGEFPALLVYEPFGKKHEEMALWFPPQTRPSDLWDGNLEAGNTRYLVSRGYAHVIVDVRGTGESEGEFPNMMGGGKDVYDVVEWVAGQTWCDGNVGMVGISYLAAMQVNGALEQPPHLKAIFPEGGHYDVYRLHYHGGILWLMPRAAYEGRGGDSAMPIRAPASVMKKTLPKEEFERRIEERLKDPDVKNYPNYHQILNYPDVKPMWLDVLLNPLDGPYWWGQEKRKDFSKIKIPVHYGAQWGRGWVTDETIECYLKAQGPKRLVLRQPPPMQERPFHQFHDEIVRWYDHWLKGKDTGVMDDPPIKLFVQGLNEYRYENEWPLARTKWTKFYLRSRHRLLPEPEQFDVGSVPPDGFYQAPLSVTSKVMSVAYTTPPFTEDFEVTGPIALYLKAVIDTDDTNWIIRMFDVDPSGRKVAITTGWLKASHREIDEARSKPWAPYYPHARSVPVKPWEVVEYPIKIHAMSNVFKKDHSMELEIRSNEDPFDPLLGVLPPDAFHLNSMRPTFHKIYRDRDNASYLLLPVIPKAVD